ncbi:MAG: SpoIIE family protein phosphatase [Cytophagales bacterium]|nr:SpoIIE family protein phosphatase [Bernardetiaceae bacterium]MDW8203808.1 SpoIIE family protein phosphatase [Cytophagales bacterium]
MKTKNLLAIVVLLMTVVQGFSQQRVMDSLQKRLAAAKTDTARIDLLIELAVAHLYTQPDTATWFCSLAIEAARKIKDYRREALALNRRGGAQFVKGNLADALKHWQTSLRIAQQINDVSLIARNWGNIGSIYSEIGSYDISLIYKTKSLHMFEAIGHQERICMQLNNIGGTYNYLKKYDSAEFFFNRALPIAQEHSKYLLPTIYSNLAEIALAKQQYAQAAAYHTQSLQLAQQLGNKREQSISYRIGASIDLATGLVNSARKKAMLAIQAAKEAQSKLELYRAYEVMSKVLFAARDYLQAYQAIDSAILYKDSVQSQTTKNALQIFEYERKQGEIALLKAQQAAEVASKERQQQWIVSVGLLGMVSLSVFSFFIYRSHKKEQRSAALLRQKNADLIHTQEQLQKKNNDITASIQYASRIQQAMLPPTERIAKVLPEHFIFFCPRDIVSGDFYWFSEQDDKCIIVAADCTGHGVPGALMSMIGSELLNQIINVQNITSPDIILQKLHSGISEALHQQESANRDGMDVALCTVDLHNRTLEYAGAMNPLYYVQNGVFHEIKADKRPIGGLPKNNAECRFQKHRILLTETPTTFYICSDGYQDQFGGKKGQKFMVKNFKNLLHEIANLPMEMQQQHLSKTFNQWKGNEPQVDDVLVIGFRI